MDGATDSPEDGQGQDPDLIYIPSRPNHRSVWHIKGILKRRDGDSSPQNPEQPNEQADLEQDSSTNNADNVSANGNSVPEDDGSQSPQRRKKRSASEMV